MRNRAPRVLVLATVSSLACALAASPALGSSGQRPDTGRPGAGAGVAVADDLHMVGSAVFTGDGGVRLVDRQHGGIAGAAYTSEPVDVGAFTLKMVFHITGSCADGLAVVVQNDGI